MTNKDVRTPASSQMGGAPATPEGEQPREAGKSIGWHKGYVGGSRPDLRVPVRQVHLTNGQSVTLYDTSGPYTDPVVDTDVRRGGGARPRDALDTPPGTPANRRPRRQNTQRAR
ncbi:hypothetical protein ACFWIZ_53560, partial [Streptomyces sp. NPDC127044]